MYLNTFEDVLDNLNVYEFSVYSFIYISLL